MSYSLHKKKHLKGTFLLIMQKIFIQDKKVTVRISMWLNLELMKDGFPAVVIKVENRLPFEFKHFLVK
ncbi:hypothetical protein AWH48_20205 [Domibacillus aminovorans]|uniref:Uncharacterized protein n=1 Tax=Domibacillus aminovorans TaxID=29332 RepID=A0A177KP90_9BACI|nr:hypothetical protein AWH48_20205 [Domibacillus aminovorans]